MRLWQFHGSLRCLCFQPRNQNDLKSVTLKAWMIEELMELVMGLKEGWLKTEKGGKVSCGGFDRRKGGGK